MYLFTAIFLGLCGIVSFIFLIYCFFSENFLIGFDNFLITVTVFVIFAPLAFFEAKSFLQKREDNYQKMIFNNVEKNLQLITFNQESFTIAYDEIKIIQIYLKEIFRGYMETNVLIQLNKSGLIEITMPTRAMLDKKGLVWRWELLPMLKEKMKNIPLNIVFR